MIENEEYLVSFRAKIKEERMSKAPNACFTPDFCETYVHNTIGHILRWVHTMNVCSSVGQRLKSLINEPKRRRNYVREKGIFHLHYERFISGAIQLLRTLTSV